MLIFPNQPNPNPIQSVIDQGHLIARKMCLLLKVKRPVSMRSMKNGFHGELGSSDRPGKPDNLSENTRVEQTHDGSGQPDECNSSSAHTVKEQFAPEENRYIVLFNTDNEFNRAINEEDIDFNIPGLPHSAVKQLHGVNVQELIQKIENHPHRLALQSDLQQRQQLNPFSKESKDMIREVGTSNCANYSMWNPKHSAKCVCRTGTSASSTGRAGNSCEMKRRRTRNSSSTLSISSRFPITTSRKGDPMGTVTGRSRGITSTSPRIRSRRNARREISWVLTTGSSVMRSSART